MNRLLTYLLVLGVALAALQASAASVKKVTGQYTYYGDQNDSPAMAKKKALEGARLKAIESEFGTIVSQDILQADRVGGKGETNKFMALSATEVKGEWIADDGAPEYTVALDGQQNLVVTCRIQGQAKPLTNEAVEFEAVALRGGTTRQHASTEYHNGDDLKMYFTAPTDGTLAVFMLDESGEVLKMLPYIGDSRPEVTAKKNFDYILFDDSKAASKEMGEPQELVLGATDGVEFLKLYVIFSPNSFSTPMMNRADGDKHVLPWLTEEKFSQWLVKARRTDPKMGVKQINLKVYPD